MIKCNNSQHYVPEAFRKDPNYYSLPALWLLLSSHHRIWLGLRFMDSSSQWPPFCGTTMMMVMVYFSLYLPPVQWSDQFRSKLGGRFNWLLWSNECYVRKYPQKRNFSRQDNCVEELEILMDNNCRPIKCYFNPQFLYLSIRRIIILCLFQFIANN